MHPPGPRSKRGSRDRSSKWRSWWWRPGRQFIADDAGEIYTYDVNTHTNYDGAAESEAGVYGMRAIAAYLGGELKKIERAEREARPAAILSPA
ncbi:MAG TPA: hypothetical protein VMN79_04260 [Casimicrobiaceae bacterium]|nr:hypothetical protein [Casimicrobiaceae bacterium]